MPLINGEMISKLSRPPRAGAASSCYQGSVSMVAGQELKLETSPAGEELLSVTCPSGKTWLVRVRVDIKVSDA